jgi:L-alanine-DL-glutamate epimerase-like enolase superfamily enzyme
MNSMKIQSIEVFAFKYDHHYRLGGHNESPNRLPGTDYYFEPQWRHAYSRFTESCLVKITTDEGLTGWGEAQAPLVPEVPATLIAKLFGPAILGLDPTDPQMIYDRLYHLSHVRGHTASYTIDAITGIDIALWDIKAQAENKPLHQLLGESHTLKLPLYVSGLRRPTLEERKLLAKEKLAEGFAGVKIFIGNTAEKTIAECRAIRETIGDKADLAFDAICAHDYETAYQIGCGLDELNATWFESPIDPEDVAGHARLAKAIKTPLAIGEPLRTVREFAPWLAQKAMRIAQPDIVRCGITGGQEIIKNALAHGLKVAPHIGVCTAIGVAATWHVASVIPDPVSQEHQLDMFETANKVLDTPLQVESGKAILPTGIGLGITVNEDFIRTHSAETWLVPSP